ncbi:hypothetical protein HF086_008909 [Spodoptera exigua]|uniref:Uncharacterized protein n=1 Tax=Spodoptera exigua TaxID=7107 RepID=A0A922SMC5_SPOEX|nr:hypothetical protein HF086_008909 [Spodoptera exigua]
MSACNVEVIKQVGRYYNVSVGTVCFNTDKVLTTVINKQSIEGFATIVLKLASLSGLQLSQEERLLSYQWLEHIAMYANQAAANPVFALGFLKDINKALEKTTYLTGQKLNVTDVAAYYVLYPLINSNPITGLPPLPKQILPHQLKNISLDKAIVYHPQPFAFPGYPVVVYL